MEGISHDLLQWGAAAAAIFALWRLWSKVGETVADKVNMQRDVEHLEKDVKRLMERDTRIYDQLEELRKEQRIISECLARLETRMNGEHR